MEMIQWSTSGHAERTTPRRQPARLQHAELQQRWWRLEKATTRMRVGPVVITFASESGGQRVLVQVWQ